MIDFYQNSSLGHLILLHLILLGWECWLHLRQACSCFPHHFRSVVCGIRDLVPSKCKGIWLKMKQYLKYQFQTMSTSSLFSFSSVTLRTFSGACSFKITLFFFKGQNYTIAIMLLLGLLTGPVYL